MSETERRRTWDVGIPAPGFRLPPDITLGRVRLQVADLHRSLHWYDTVLGLRPVDTPPAADTPAVTLCAADGTALVELVEQPRARRPPQHGRLGLYHYAILLPTRADLGAFVRHLSDIGAPAGASDHLVSEALYLTDPDGLGIEVYADRPRTTWRRNADEIAMATAPLDVDSLVHAAGDTPWRGMPAGTTMGHVHLHVGDIGAASAFYHEALGLDKVVWSYPGALFLSAGGYHHHLGLNTWARNAPPAADDEARLLEWQMMLPSVESHAEAVASLERAGHEVAADTTSPDAVVKDPWGTRLRLLARG